MILKAILVGVAFFAVIEAGAVEGLPEPDKHIDLACAGFLVAGETGKGENSIITNGAVDFTSRRVRGFGIGSAPIVYVSATELRFGSSPVRIESGAHMIEGSINRTTGETHIAIRLSKDPSRTLIDMTLACRLTPSVS